MSAYSLTTREAGDKPKIDFAITPGGSFVIFMYSNYISSTNNYGRRLVCTMTELRLESVNNRTVASDIIMQGTRVLSTGATFSARASVKVSKNMIQLTSPYSNTWIFYRIQCYGIK